MVTIELEPDLAACVQTLAARQYARLLRDALATPGEAAVLRERLETLRLFLEHTDFPALRTAYEPHLAAGRTVMITISGDGTTVRHRIHTA